MTYPDDYINKIICGNCLEIMREIPDGSIDLVVTSPPYNMRTRIRNGKYTTRETAEHSSKKYSHFGDDLSPPEYYEFHRNALLEMLRVSCLVAWNVQIVTGNKSSVFRLFGEFHDRIRDLVIWDKGHAVPAIHENVISRRTEIIVFFEPLPTTGRAFTKAYFSKGTLDDLWQMKRGSSVKGHRACFPLVLPAKIIQNWTKANSVVLDPFAGSGTTPVAAKQLGHKYIGIEICPEYCCIAEDRLKQEELF